MCTCAICSAAYSLPGWKGHRARNLRGACLASLSWCSRPSALLSPVERSARALASAGPLLLRIALRWPLPSLLPLAVSEAVGFGRVGLSSSASVNSRPKKTPPHLSGIAGGCAEATAARFSAMARSPVTLLLSLASAAVAQGHVYQSYRSSSSITSCCWDGLLGGGHRSCNA